jgi:hypothetical protein
MSKRPADIEQENIFRPITERPAYTGQKKYGGRARELAKTLLAIRVLASSFSVSSIFCLFETR